LIYATKKHFLLTRFTNFGSEKKYYIEGDLQINIPSNLLIEQIKLLVHFLIGNKPAGFYDD
jgi:hypothetical protein